MSPKLRKFERQVVQRYLNFTSREITPSPSSLKKNVKCWYVLVHSNFVLRIIFILIKWNCFPKILCNHLRSPFLLLLWRLSPPSVSAFHTSFYLKGHCSVFYQSAPTWMKNMAESLGSDLTTYISLVYHLDDILKTQKNSF